MEGRRRAQRLSKLAGTGGGGWGFTINTLLLQRRHCIALGYILCLGSLTSDLGWDNGSLHHVAESANAGINILWGGVCVCVA